MVLLTRYTTIFFGTLLLMATVLSMPLNSPSTDNDQTKTSRPMTETSPSSSVRVLSNNVYFLPELLLNWGQRTRAGLIVKSDYIKNNDVVVIQECFSAEPCKILREGLKSQYPYQTPTLGQTRQNWNSTSGSYSVFSPVNGGVVLMSKWPIKEKHQFIYKTGCGNDWYSNKGFVYVVLDYNGTNIHVFGTHMQSSDSRCFRGQAELCRAQAMDAWRSFLSDRKIPSGELVLFAGDFNIDRNTTEFNSTLTSPHLLLSHPPTPRERQANGGKGGGGSSDISIDKDGDSGLGGKTIEKVTLRAPDDYLGHNSTWDGTENSIAHYTGPNNHDYIDFVFVVENEDPSPIVQSLVQTVLKVHSPDFKIGGQVYNDYSDHYPILATITLKNNLVHQGNVTTV